MKTAIVLLTIATIARGAEPYATPAATVDAGGARATSANYSHDGSLGGIGGSSTASTPQVAAKHGYIGQLTEVTGISILATPNSVNEGSTLQLAALQLLDDATTATLDPATVAWSVVSGPLASVSPSGLAAADTVYQTTPATVQGGWGGHLSGLVLSVINVNADDYRTYAADGIDDDWQVLYFGAPPNAKAAAPADPDGDGQNNLLEFLAGVVPDDAASRLLFRVEPVAGQPAWKNFVFSPRLPGRTYVVETNADLGALWSPLFGAPVSDNGSERTVTDQNAGAASKFYRLAITKP